MNFAVQLWGEPGPPGPSPHTPHLPQAISLRDMVAGCLSPKTWLMGGLTLQLAWTTSPTTILIYKPAAGNSPGGEAEEVILQQMVDLSGTIILL